MSPEMTILLEFFTKKSLFFFPFLKVLISMLLKSLASKFSFNFKSDISIFVFSDKKIIFFILKYFFNMFFKNF